MSDERNIYGGLYKRYDGKYFVVVTTANDYETGEETVILMPHTYSNKTEYLTISKKDFCKSVTRNNRRVKLFTRQTHLPTPDFQWGKIKSDGFKNVHRVKNTADEFARDCHESYFFSRAAQTYPDYAKALCRLYAKDKRKVMLCIKSKKYVAFQKKSSAHLKKTVYS